MIHNMDTMYEKEEEVEIIPESGIYHPKNFRFRNGDLSGFLRNNSHPLFDSVKEVLFAKYKVVMKFSIHIYGNAGTICVNGNWLVTRKKKFGPVYINKHVKLIEGKATKIGGSNAYPLPTFKNGYCILEFVTFGLPVVDGSGWKGEILSLDKIPTNNIKDEE